MVYKKGPKFKIRPVKDIKEDLFWAKNFFGKNIRTVFFPSGNTIVMKTNDLIEIFSYTKSLFPNLERITIYGSSQYIVKKGVDDMKKISEAGLSRIHVGLESGNDNILEMVRKGSDSKTQIKAGKLVKDANIQLSEYVVLGLGGKDKTKEHIEGTIKVLNKVDPDFIRIRTFLPKINTPILDDIKNKKFKVLTPYEILSETYRLISGLNVKSVIASDHYTNYIRVDGKLPEDKEFMLSSINKAMKRKQHSFRDVYIGTE
jgi:radical SAM superfamily enzyme YgiQ (UPF0313 family)